MKYFVFILGKYLLLIIWFSWIIVYILIKFYNDGKKIWYILKKNINIVLLFCNFWFIDFLNVFLKVKNDEILFFKVLRVCKFFL